jgi:hypothetical protein
MKRFDMKRFDMKRFEKDEKSINIQFLKIRSVKGF